MHVQFNTEKSYKGESTVSKFIEVSPDKASHSEKSFQLLNLIFPKMSESQFSLILPPLDVAPGDAFCCNISTQYIPFLHTPTQSVRSLLIEVPQWSRQYLTTGHPEKLISRG